MNVVHLVVGVLCIVLVACAALWGAWCWYRVNASRLFWRLLRAGQACVVLEAALGGVLLLLGKKDSSLHLIYGLLPLAVSFVGEQLRIASAQMVLDSRGLESSAAVGEAARGRAAAGGRLDPPARARRDGAGRAGDVVLLIRAAGTAP